MSIYQFKSSFQKQLRPISDALVDKGATANQVTVAAVLLSAGTAYVIYRPTRNHQALWLLLPPSLLLRMAMNAIDGMMAKEHGQLSQLGMVLNEAGDIASDTVLLLSLTPHLSQTDYARVVLLGCLLPLTTATELLAMVSLQVTGERANQGPLGKSDRALQLGVLGLLLGMGWYPESSNPKQKVTATYCLLISNILLLTKTLYNRGDFIMQYVQHKQKHAVNPSLITTKDRSQGRIMSANKPASLSPSSTKHLEFNAGYPTEAVSDDATQSCFNSYDGTALYYRYWLSRPLADIHNDPSDCKVVVMLHRGHEHSGRLTHLAHAFVQAGYQVFAWDARGNGRSGGERDHADSFTQLVRDLDVFVAVVSQQLGISKEQILLLANSLGAVIATAWVHDYAPNIRGLILGTPAFAIRLYVPFATPALKAAKKLGLVSRVSSYVKSKLLTHDQAAQQAYDDDPLISGSISRDLLLDSLATGQRLLDDAGAITLPTLILCAGKDYVVDKGSVRQFYEDIRSPDKQWILYPDNYHALFHESNKADVIADCLAFADRQFAQHHQSVDLTCAHAPDSLASSYSKDRIDRLAVAGFNPAF